MNHPEFSLLVGKLGDEIRKIPEIRMLSEALLPITS
jgi:hypothetical protein